MSDFPFSIPRRTGPAAAGGLPGFTPVIHTARWNTNSDQLGNRTIVGDDIIQNEGITPGTGTQGIAYGVSVPIVNGTPINTVGYFKVSEEMAGIYTFTVSVNATAFSSSSDDGPSIKIERFLLGREGGNGIAVLAANNVNRASQTDQHTFIHSVTTRLLPEEQFEYNWTVSFKLKGNNASNPGGWFSITKIAN